MKVADVGAKELAKLARRADLKSGSDGRVVALHARNSGELLQVGTQGGECALCWPSRPRLAAPVVLDAPGESPDSARALLATAELKSAEQKQVLQARAGALLSSSVKQGDILGGLVLAEDDAKNASARIVILSVSHPDSPDGACFDPEFAGADWRVERFEAVHPPLAAWAAAAGASAEEDGGEELGSAALHTVNVPARKRIPTPSREAEDDDTTPVVRVDPASHPPVDSGPGHMAKASDAAPKARLVLGDGALDGVAIKMRDVANLSVPDEALYVFTVAGWNTARIQPYTMECDAGMEAGHLRMRVGANIGAASLTVDVLRRSIATLREAPTHVIAGFGGGAVLDGTKAIAALAGQPDVAVEEALEAIQAAAKRGEHETTVRLPAAPLPAMLIPGIPGSGAELSERMLISARIPSSDGLSRRHSVFVVFDYPPSVVRHSNERTCLVDPRLHSPRRMNGLDAAQGGLLVIATALDCLICSTASPQTHELASDALLHASDNILLAAREPTSSDGPSRDGLVRASAAAALARDTLGLGVGTLLTTTIVDSLRDGHEDGEFRQVAVRVAASVVREAGRFEALEKIVDEAARVCTGETNADGEALAMWLVRRAEDVGVPQLRGLGASRKRVLESVAKLAEDGCVRNAPHPAFETAETLLRVAEDALENQPFEL